MDHCAMDTGLVFNQLPQKHTMSGLHSNAKGWHVHSSTCAGGLPGTWTQKPSN